MRREDLRALLTSLENAARRVIAARNEFSLVGKLPSKTLITIFEFVAEPRTRESTFKLVKMTHVCQNWRSTLLSLPHLWSSIFVKNDRKEFVAACLERSRDVSLAVSIDLRYGNYRNYREFQECICYLRMPSSKVTEENPCRYHTTILPLLNADYTKRIRKLDVHLTLIENAEEPANYTFSNALRDLTFFKFPLPSLESLCFDVVPEFESDIDTHLVFPNVLFDWRERPPADLHQLILRGCYGGPILSVRNLTSFELAGVRYWDPILLDQRTFFPFISASPSLVSLSLTRCKVPDRSKLLDITPLELPQLRTLRLTNVHGSHGLPYLLKIPALKTLSSLHILTQKRREGRDTIIDFRVQAQSDDGFQFSFDVLDLNSNDEHNDRLVLEWLTAMHDADPRPTFVRFEGRDFDPKVHYDIKGSPLSLIINAKVLEVDASSVGHWYPNFWGDLEKIGPQLTTLRLGVTQSTERAVATSVKKFVKTRLEKGMPLGKLERMTFEGVSEQDDVKAEGLWGNFRAGLGIEQYLDVQRL